MRDDLPICESHIRCTIHGSKIVLPFRRSKWCAGQLLVLHRYSVAMHGLFEQLEVVACHLMAESTRSAMDHDNDLILAGNPECRCRRRLEDPIVRYYLDFQVVIARSQCPELIDSPAHGLIGDL